MAIMAKKSESSFELTPAGTHTGRCYMVVDLGTQKTVWQGQEKKQHKVLLGFELPDEKMSDGRPFAISNQYTLSLSDKARLRSMLEAWRGQPFTEEEAGGFDITKLLGVPCMLTVVHNKSGDKTYANIAGIVKMPKSMTCPDQVNKSITFSLDEYNEQGLAELPEWIQKKIMQSDEYMAIVGHQEQPHAQHKPDFDDDIPF